MPVSLPAGLLSKRKEPSHTREPLSIPYAVWQHTSCYGWTPARVCYGAAVPKQGPPARLRGPGQLGIDAGGSASSTLTRPQAGAGQASKEAQLDLRDPTQTWSHHHPQQHPPWLLFPPITVFGPPLPPLSPCTADAPGPFLGIAALVFT